MRSQRHPPPPQKEETSRRTHLITLTDCPLEAGFNPHAIYMGAFICQHRKAADSVSSGQGGPEGGEDREATEEFRPWCCIRQQPGALLSGRLGGAGVMSSILEERCELVRGEAAGTGRL